MGTEITSNIYLCHLFSLKQLFLINRYWQDTAVGSTVCALDRETSVCHHVFRSRLASCAWNALRSEVSTGKFRPPIVTGAQHYTSIPQAVTVRLSKLQSCMLDPASCTCSLFTYSCTLNQCLPAPYEPFTLNWYLSVHLLVSFYMFTFAINPWTVVCICFLSPNVHVIGQLMDFSWCETIKFVCILRHVYIINHQVRFTGHLRKIIPVEFFSF